MNLLIVFILVGLAAIAAVLFFVVPPIVQFPWYHDFADQRLLLGIPNFWNVISNLPFLIVGMWEMWYVVSNRFTDGVPDLTERWMYLFFFFTVALTGIGSAYYHLEPNNDRLVWDRLPLAMMFMALFAIIIAERFSHYAGTWLFLPVVVLGAATVFYWHLSETWGRGRSPSLSIDTNLSCRCHTDYFYSSVRPLTHKTEKLYAAMAWYAGAKLIEFLDKDLYSFGQILSGHTLKHIGAAASCYLVLSWIRQRRLVRNPIVQSDQLSTITEQTSKSHRSRA